MTDIDSPLNALLEEATRHAIRYRETVDQSSPYPSATIDELRAGFDIPLMEEGRPGVEVISHLASTAETGLVGNAGNGFFGWVMGGSDQVGVAADILTSAWGQNAGIYQTAPAAAIAEEVASKWLLDLLGLPDHASIGFTTGATMASFICLAAARQKILTKQGWDIDADGMIGAPAIKVFLSEEAHTSIFAALRMLGFGRNQLIKVKTDTQGRMLIDDVTSKVRDVAEAGIIIAQAGHINSGACDDFRALAALATETDAWLHIDGAFGLWAKAAKSTAYLCDGVELADSWAVDGHKWLQVPYDSGYAIVRDSTAHQAAMSSDASYLNKDLSDGRHPSHYVPELSRRARGFATWAILQALGRSGIAALVEGNCANARRLADQLQSTEGIYLLNEPCLNQLAISFGDNADIRQNTDTTLKVIRCLQDEARWFVKEATWKGRTIMRVSFSGATHSDDEIDAFARAISKAWDGVR